jgi:hypothetical protein
MYRGSVTVRRMLLAALAAIWAVMPAVPVSAAAADARHAGREVTLSSRAPGTPTLVTDFGASRVLRAHDASGVRAVGETGVDDDDVDIDSESDESKRSGHERYSAVLPRAPDTALHTIATPHVSRISSLVRSASVACPQGRAPPTVLS